MKLTIIQTGEVPEPLRLRFGPYPMMFRRMFAEAGADFDYDVVRAFDGEALPDPRGLEAILITGSAAGVYENHPWLDPLRAFIRNAYATRTPLIGICFGHQIMADALGGDVRRSEKGWGIGRHVYEVTERPAFMRSVKGWLAVACSHQDQVIVPPSDAQVFLTSEFTPNAGLVYANGAAISVQPHPEFADDYMLALAELRRGIAPDAVVETALASASRPSDSPDIAAGLVAFLAR